MKQSLERLIRIRDLGFSPQCILDGGAFTGRWAREAHAIFPDAHIILVEPNPLLQEEIAKYTAEFAEKTTLVAKALADKPKEVILHVWEDARHNNPITAMAASSLCSHVQGEPARQMPVPATTVDAIVAETGFLPDLVKLDLQGGEKYALAGATQTLQYAEFVIVEFGCLDAYIDRTTPNDVMQCLYAHGYALYDIVDLLYRPYDGALAGGDFFFVKKDSKLKAYKDYF